MCWAFVGQIVDNNSGDSAKTSDHVYSRPWAIAIVFKIDGNNSNQHIWNQGEGTGSNDDNIAVRLSASKNLYLHWGRPGSENECQITYSGGVLDTSKWYGLFVAHKGARFSASNATASNLADAFDIRLMSSSDGFSSVGSNLSTSSSWLNTGDRMDRAIGGDFTIGGRGSNRNFHGKVARMIITTLRRDVAMPTDAEIKAMITDPVQWVSSYKNGQTFRYGNGTTEATFRATGRGNTENFATIDWPMGDGASDDLMSNGIRNLILPTDQNNTRLQGNSLNANDEENVSINGLS